MIFEVAHHMGLVPLAWLLVRGERRTEWWWLAAAFAVSWVADTASHWASPWMVIAVYPITQAAIVVAVLAPRKDAQWLAGVFVIAGIMAVFMEGVTGPALFLETVTAGAIVAVVYPLPLGRLRTALIVAFGGGWMLWMAYAIAPGWVTWGGYQLVRAVSLGLFCWASMQVRPALRISHHVRGLHAGAR